MTNLENARQVIADLKITNRNRIIELMWCPLQLIYVELAKAKDIKPLAELDEKTKRDYWKETKEAPRHKRIWICQALYVYDTIFELNRS